MKFRRAIKSLRSAIVTIATKARGENKTQLLTFHWFVVEFNDKEIVLVETVDSEEAVVIPRKDVISISYAS